MIRYKTKRFKSSQKGSAIALALVIGSVLLMLALGYSKLTSNTTRPSYKVDEHARLQYLADGLAQMVLLKFQKYPSDFFDAWDHDKAKKNWDLVNKFGSSAEEFASGKFQNKDDQPTSLFSSIGTKNDDTEKINIQVASMSLHLVNQSTDGSNAEYVLTIHTIASYNSKYNGYMSADSYTTVLATRRPLE